MAHATLLYTVEIAAILSILFGFHHKAEAHLAEEGMIWATVGPLVNRTLETPQAPGDISKYYNGLGLIVEGDTSHHGGLELGILHVERQYHLKHQGNFVVQRVNRLHAPIGYRYWFNERLSAMVAFYSSYRMGNIEDVYRHPSIDKNVKTSAEKKPCEYGFDFAAQWEILRFNRYAAVFDWRYSHVINEVAHESADHMTILIGLKYLVQSKTIAPP